MLLGVRFLLGDIVKLGGVSLVCVVLELAMAIAVMTALGRWFKLSPKLTSLLSIGASICGVSAIIAAKGAIDADDEDASYAIAAILALGAVSLVVFPLDRPRHRHERPRLRPVGRPRGRQHGRSGGSRRVVFRRGRALRRAGEDDAQRDDWLRRARLRALLGAPQSEAREIANKGAFLWEKFPKFVLGFLVISTVATLGAFSARQSTDLANLSRWAFLFTFAGVGLRTNVGELSRQGWRPLAVGVVGEVAIAVLTLAMVVFAARTFVF